MFNQIKKMFYQKIKLLLFWLSMFLIWSLCDHYCNGTSIFNLFICFILICFIFIIKNYLESNSVEIELLKKHNPSIDIESIFTLLDQFCNAVRMQSNSRLKDLISPEQPLLLADIQKCVSSYRETLEYYSIAKPICLKIFVEVYDDTVKIEVNNNGFNCLNFDDETNVGEFYHYFVVKKYHEKWIIIDTNLCKELRKKEIKRIIFIIIIVILGCIYCIYNRAFILKEIIDFFKFFLCLN